MNKLKNKKINAILVISAFIFNILIFAPLEIYYTNNYNSCIYSNFNMSNFIIINIKEKR